MTISVAVALAIAGCIGFVIGVMLDDWLDHR